MSESYTIEQLQAIIESFCDERDWGQFNTPKDVAMALSIEASELMEIFRFVKDEETQTVLQNRKVDIEDECADVFYFLLRFAQLYDVNLIEAFIHKMEKNAQKYPKEKAKGSNKKYDEL